MRHFSQLTAADLDRLFSHPPQAISRSSQGSTLATALGATLYMPATRRGLGDDLDRLGAKGVLSTVICLEDAIADGDVRTAQANLLTQLRVFAGSRAGTSDDGPLIFVRVRCPEQISPIVDGLGDYTGVLSGFVLPKFTGASGPAYLEALDDAALTAGVRLFGMPVIESAEVIHRETRDETLHAIQVLLAKYRDSVLAVRIGATDLCAAYGIRRGAGLTIYDVRPVAEVIADVVNVLGRADESGHLVTGPVWEYFAGPDRLFKPQLRQTPFDNHDAGDLRHALISSNMEGLLREVTLDKANGLTGKTVIHPSHVPAVHALMVVTAEEFADATDIVRANAHGGGVCASTYHNKMNESKPHRAWAERTLDRAAAFGVAAEGISTVDLLVAGSQG